MSFQLGRDGHRDYRIIIAQLESGKEWERGVGKKEKSRAPQMENHNGNYVTLRGAPPLGTINFLSSGQPRAGFPHSAEYFSSAERVFLTRALTELHESPTSCLTTVEKASS